MASSKQSSRLRPAVPLQRRSSARVVVDLVKRPRVDLRKRPKVSLVKVRPPLWRRPLRQTLRRAARSTRAWSRRPSGRMVLPGLLLAALVALAASAGVFVVPSGGTAPQARASASTAPPPTGTLPPEGDRGLALPPDFPAGGGLSSPSPSGTLPAGLTRPADSLLTWASAMSPKVGVPVAALQAYGLAELALAQFSPGCNLKWTTLAGIGRIETNHGSANSARLGSDGKVTPPIFGPALDGTGNRKRITDTDTGRIDFDTVYDRAVGPMQFLPTTWASYASDGDADQLRDPHDLDDAALAAGYYLCAGGRDLATAGGWWSAVLAYNNVQTYADSVFNAANDYGVRSRV